MKILNFFNMPIINGQYVYDTIPQSKDNKLTDRVFGPDNNLGGRDWSDTTTAAYNYLLKQQEQAYNLELWNLQNQYNSPAEQMKRYQDAGLNPNLIYGQQNEASSPASASAATFRSSSPYARKVQNAMSMINQIVGIVKSARDTYDYMKYGREASSWQNALTMQRSQGEALRNYWDQYLLGMSGEGSTIPGSPKARMYAYQMDTQRQRYEQLVALVSMIPDQQERVRALKALDDYRLQIMQGQSSAILNIHTGNQTVDSFLKMLGFYLLKQ